MSIKQVGVHLRFVTWLNEVCFQNNVVVWNKNALTKLTMMPFSYSISEHSVWKNSY